MDYKTEQEWLIVRDFKNQDPLFPKGRLIKSESPDFKLRMAKGAFIGIELTRIRMLSEEAETSGILRSTTGYDQVLATLEAKEKKIGVYRKQKPDSLWLIIFADHSEPRAMEKLNKTLLHNKLTTQFDRVCFFNLDNHAIQTLK